MSATKAIAINLVSQRLSFESIMKEIQEETSHLSLFSEQTDNEHIMPKLYSFPIFGNEMFYFDFLIMKKEY